LKVLTKSEADFMQVTSKTWLMWKKQSSESCDVSTISSTDHSITNMKIKSAHTSFAPNLKHK
jgi:hypothetical protein